jgi:GTPase involved in cell partitioning and DNA repair
MHPWNHEVPRSKNTSIVRANQVLRLSVYITNFRYLNLSFPFDKFFSIIRDLPGIIEGAADGRGRGKQVISTARTCNLILIVLDAAKPVTHKKIIEQELFNFGIRINQEVGYSSVMTIFFISSQRKLERLLKSLSSL